MVWLKRRIWRGVNKAIIDTGIEYKPYEIIIITANIYMQFYNIVKNNIQIKITDDQIASTTEFVVNEYETKKAQNIDFSEVENYLRKINKYNLLLMSPEEIEDIVNIYYNSEELIKFSTNYFDIRMYKVANSDRNIILANKLKKIHYNIICPLVNYYKLKTNIIDDNVETLYNKEEKGIELKINGINPNIILKDILSISIFIPINEIPEVISKDTILIKL